MLTKHFSAIASLDSIFLLSQYRFIRRGVGNDFKKKIILAYLGKIQ